jgi:hypothetical protein
MDRQDSSVVDGVAYEVDVATAQEYRYMVRVNGCSGQTFLASNSFRKIKEAVRARRMLFAWITRNDDAEFVLSARGGRQVMHEAWPYKPRY